MTASNSQSIIQSGLHPRAPLRSLLTPSRVRTMSCWSSQSMRAGVSRVSLSWRASLTLTSRAMCSWATTLRRSSSQIISRSGGSSPVSSPSRSSYTCRLTPWMRTCLSNNRRTGRSYPSSWGTTCAISCTHSRTSPRKSTRHWRTCRRSSVRGRNQYWCSSLPRMCHNNNNNSSSSSSRRSTCSSKHRIGHSSRMEGVKMEEYNTPRERGLIKQLISFFIRLIEFIHLVPLII